MDNNIRVKVYPASNGESILIQCNGEKQTNILIDCGYISTYKFIKEDLIRLKNEGKKIDLLVLTHIDNDHINGARNLLQDYIDNKICEISEIWYNDYFSIYNIGKNNKTICDHEYGIFKFLRSDQYPIDPNETGEETISYKSANLLVKYLLDAKINMLLNKSFKDAVYIDSTNILKEIEIGNDVKIILLGPTKEILSELLEEWRKYLENEGFKEDIVNSRELAEAFELFYVNLNEDIMENQYSEEECSSKDELNQYLDFDIPDLKLENRSSISFIIKFKDKQLLFLGDSSPQDYEKILEELLKNSESDKLNFDLVKVSHHGSKYNTSKNLFNMIISNRYLISTNGSTFNHPDLETISKIIVNQNEDKTLYFNYKLMKVEGFLDDYEYRLKDNKFNIECKNENLLDDEILLINIGER